MDPGPQRLTVDAARQLTFKATAPARTTEESLYDSCCKRVRQEAATGHLQASCVVPQFIFGLPLFNRRIMRDKLALRFEREGWTVSCYGQEGLVIGRPVYVDSALGQIGQASPGQVKLKLANALKGVSRVRLRDAQIPRLDDIPYVAVGLRCGRGAFIDNVQVPYDPNAVTTSGLFNVTSVSPGPPIFAVLPIAQVTSTNAIDYAASVPYVYLNQERYDFEFKPPINSMDDLEIQLYRPPLPSAPSTFAPYDTRVYVVTLDVAPTGDYAGVLVTNKALSDQRSLPYFFTATVVTVSGFRLLLGAASSSAALAAYSSFLGQAGLLPEERTLYTSTGNAIGTATGVTPTTTQATLNLEFDCAS
ncbi:hypothetical protein WJX74_010228 [Apatococcus lobatus]|uniref:Uncharacterized protein n=1 Tax=Apatococcus lobatus TaxID=904363 RepID=A0AAW1Q5K9_9CHLO